MNECRKFVIKGRVQGVWFRESTRREAERFGITGFAINRPDGSVEVLACGGPEALVRLHEWLHHGPPMALVSSVAELATDAECPADFTTG